MSVPGLVGLGWVGSDGRAQARRLLSPRRVAAPSLASPPHTAQVLLNPFYTPHTRIEARDFDGRVKALSRKYLGYKGE